MSMLNFISSKSLESFRFSDENEYEYEYEIFS